VLSISGKFSLRAWQHAPIWHVALPEVAHALCHDLLHAGNLPPGYPGAEVKVVVALPEVAHALCRDSLHEANLPPVCPAAGVKVVVA